MGEESDSSSAAAGLALVIGTGAFPALALKR